MEDFGENDIPEEHVDAEDEAELLLAEEDYAEEEEREESVSIEAPVIEINKMKLPKDAAGTYNVYKSSPKVDTLLSEKKRTIFAEAFLADEKKHLDKVLPLTELCIDAILQNFQGGNLDPRIQGELRSQFSEKLDVNFSLLNIMDLDLDSYWKRVFLSKCKNRVLVYQISHSENVDWKKLGVREKLRELLENSRFEEWSETDMISIMQKVATYIDELQITQLIPLEEYSIEKDPNLAKYKIYNYPPDDCHHINLGILGELKNLVSLHIEFQPPALGYKYERRFFLFSRQDIENLANGLVQLPGLKELKFRRSKMDNKKLVVLVRALVQLNTVEILDLSYCKLRNECGWTFSYLLGQANSIKELILDGNYFESSGIASLFYGIQNFKGFLKHVSLARNPIEDEGVKYIGRGLNNKHQIEHLNLNGVIVTTLGAFLVTHLINLSPTLNHLEISALPLGKEGGTSLIRNLENNRNVLQLNCRACDLTAKQESLIQVLLLRNNYLKKLPFSPKTGSDAEERQKLNQLMENYVKQTKNPVLLKAINLIEKVEECEKSTPKVTEFPSNIPNFIPPAACVLKTNKQLLHGVYYDTPSATLNQDFRKQGEDEKFVFDPNNFTTREEFLEFADGGVATSKCKRDSFISGKRRKHGSLSKPRDINQ